MPCLVVLEPDGVAEDSAVNLLGHLDVPRFRHRALCAETSPDDWYPEAHDHGAAQRAKRICRRCPALDECLEWALTRPEQEGIWGGMSAEERKERHRLLRQRVSVEAADLLSRKDSRLRRRLPRAPRASRRAEGL